MCRLQTVSMHTLDVNDQSDVWASAKRKDILINENLIGDSCGGAKRKHEMPSTHLFCTSTAPETLILYLALHTLSALWGHVYYRLRTVQWYDVICTAQPSTKYSYAAYSILTTYTISMSNGMLDFHRTKYVFVAHKMISFAHLPQFNGNQNREIEMRSNFR